jgi:hypothetical protein
MFKQTDSKPGDSIGHIILSFRALKQVDNMKYLLFDFLFLIAFFYIQCEINYIEVKYPLKVSQILKRIDDR